MVNQLRSKLTVEKLLQCFSYYMEDCYPKEDLGWEEFDHIFSSTLNNCRPTYEALQENSLINIYEVFIICAIFVKDTDYNEKLLCIFKAFDVDDGGTLDRRELAKFLLCSILGICKLLKLKTPSKLGIQQFTYEQFKIVDEDGSGSIDFDEFDEWISNSHEIQDFMLRYTGVQTFKFAQMRYKKER